MLLTGNKSPNLPFINISLGPVGQLLDIIGMLYFWASIRTFGPSNFEINTKISLDSIVL